MKPSEKEGVSIAKAMENVRRDLPESADGLEGVRAEQLAEWIWEFLVAKLAHDSDPGPPCNSVEDMAAGGPGSQSGAKTKVPVEELVELLGCVFPQPEDSATWRRRKSLFLLAEGSKARVVNGTLLVLLEEVKELCEACHRSKKVSLSLLEALLAARAAVVLNPIRAPCPDWGEFERLKGEHFPAILVPETVENADDEGVSPMERHIEEALEIRVRKDVWGITRDMGARKLKGVLDRYTKDAVLNLVDEFVEQEMEDCGPTVIERIERDVRRKRYRPSWLEALGSGGGDGEAVAEDVRAAGGSGDGAESSRRSTIPGLPANAKTNWVELRALFPHFPKLPAKGLVVAEDSPAPPDPIGSGSGPGRDSGAGSVAGEKRPLADEGKGAEPSEARREGSGGAEDVAKANPRSEARGDKHPSASGLALPPWGKEIDTRPLKRKMAGDPKTHPTRARQLSPVSSPPQSLPRAQDARSGGDAHERGAEGCPSTSGGGRRAAVLEELRENTERMRTVGPEDPLPESIRIAEEARKEREDGRGMRRQECDHSGGGATAAERGASDGGQEEGSGQSDPRGGGPKVCMTFNERQKTARTRQWSEDSPGPRCGEHEDLDGHPGLQSRGNSPGDGSEVVGQDGVGGAQPRSQPRPVIRIVPPRRQFSPLRSHWDTFGGAGRRPKRAGPSKTSKVAKVWRKWSREEEETLVNEVVFQQMEGRWKKILNRHPDIFDGRDGVDLKDKWRNICRRDGVPKKALKEHPKQQAELIE